MIDAAAIHQTNAIKLPAQGMIENTIAQPLYKIACSVLPVEYWLPPVQ